MNIVYVIQAGEAGPIRISTATLDRLNGRIRQMQGGNSEPLVIRHVFAGDDHAAANIHRQLAEHRIAGDWFHPSALDHIPEGLERVPFDELEQERKLKRRRLTRLARGRA